MIHLNDVQQKQLDSVDQFLKLSDPEELKLVALSLAEGATASVLAGESSNPLECNSFLKEMFLEMQNMRYEITMLRGDVSKLQMEQKELLEAMVMNWRAEDQYRHSHEKSQAEDRLRQVAIRHGMTVY